MHRRADDGTPPGIAARSRDSTSVSGARVAKAAPRRAKDDTDGVVLLLLILLIVVGTGNDNDAMTSGHTNLPGLERVSWKSYVRRTRSLRTKVSIRTLQSNDPKIGKKS